MLAQAAGLALLAACYPAALLVLAGYLAHERSRPIGLMFVAGAMAASAVVALAVYALLKSGHLDLARQHPARYGLRLGLGLLMLALSAFLLWRGRRARRPASASDGRLRSRFGGLRGRLLTNPRRALAFAVGFGLFFCSVTFISAVQVVATARSGAAITVLALVLVIVLYAASAWLPYLLYLASPDGTGRTLRALNAWLAVHGRVLYLGALAVAGVAVTLDGALGLAGVV